MTSSPPSRRRNLRCRLALAGLLAATVAWHAYDLSAPGLTDRSGRLKAPDFLQFYTYGALANAGRWDGLYDQAAHAAVARERVDPALVLTDFHPNYSPLIAWLLGPLASLPFLRALSIFLLVSVVAYACAAATLTSVARRVRRDMALAALAIAAFPALMAVLRYGQLSAISLLILSIAVLCAARGQHLLAGLVLGLLAYKPNLLVVPALVWLAGRHWAMLSGLVLGAGAEMALNLTLAGELAMRQYLAVLAAIARRPQLVQLFPAESHSVRGFVTLLGGGDVVSAVATILAVPVAAWLALAVWRRHEDWRPRWAALTTAALVASPHLLTYDLLLLAVPMVLAVDWLVDTSRWDRTEGWRWALALIYFGAWPGTFIARLYHVQLSTLGMLGLLWLLARAPRADPA